MEVRKVAAKDGVANTRWREGERALRGDKLDRGGLARCTSSDLGRSRADLLTDGIAEARLLDLTAAAIWGGGGRGRRAWIGVARTGNAGEQVGLAEEDSIICIRSGSLNGVHGP